MRLIDADELIKENAYASDMWDRETQSFDLPIVEVGDIENAPSIDIVWCKECKHMYDGIKGDGYLICHKFNHFIKADDFCSYGERRADGQDIQSATE